MALLQYTDVSKCFGKTQAVSNVSLDLEAGCVVGLLGPNGSGKTTMIKMACGLYTPTQGQTSVSGYAAGSAQAKAATAYLPDVNFLPKDRRIDQLLKLQQDFFADFNVDKAMAMLTDLGLNVHALPKQLSKGTQEKLQLVLTMAREAQLYLLDEPIGGVDPAARDYILKTIINNYNPDACVVIATHLISEIENILDDVVFIRQGTIIHHDSAEVLRENTGMSVDALFRKEFAC